MTPWYIATEPFTPQERDRWDRYVAWSGLTQLSEVVSLDGMLCPTILRDLKDEYWPHIVNENFMLNFFVDLDFLMAEVSEIARKNVLCVFRNPSEPPIAPSSGRFEFLGYDLVDREGTASALTNCGGFPDVFDIAELSRVGLMEDFRRAADVQEKLILLHPKERHANCHRWAIFRLIDA